MMIKNGEKMNQREKFYYGRELFYNDEIEKAIAEILFIVCDK